jgi:hypothetical protein
VPKIKNELKTKNLFVGISLLGLLGLRDFGGRCTCQALLHLEAPVIGNLMGISNTTLFMPGLVQVPLSEKGALHYSCQDWSWSGITCKFQNWRMSP